MTVHITYRPQRDQDCAHCQGGDVDWCFLSPSEHRESEHLLCARCEAIATTDPENRDAHPRQRANELRTTTNGATA